MTMTQRKNRYQAGFVITVEMLLIFTLVILAVLVALAALRNALVDSGLVLRPQLVFDSSAPDSRLVGKVFDFSDSETPRIRRRDPNNGLTVLLGVRPGRFASRAPVFYSGPDCTGVPYVKGPAFLGPVAAVSPALEERLSVFNRLQGIVYAVGAPTAVSVAGTLFRDAPSSTPCTPISACPSAASVYVSSWEYVDALEPGAPPPSASSPSELNPCRDFAAPGPRLGLVLAQDVTDPSSSANILAPFQPPFGVR